MWEALYSLLALFAKLALLPSSQHWVLLKINIGIFKCNLSSELPWRPSVTRTIRQLAAFNQPWTNLNWCQTLAKKDGYVKDIISHSYYYRCKTIGFHKISAWGRMHGAGILFKQDSACLFPIFAFPSQDCQPQLKPSQLSYVPRF